MQVGVLSGDVGYGVEVGTARDPTLCLMLAGSMEDIDYVTNALLARGPSK